jgi:DHA1 family tetracycline resistance protein-like MFS transporter
LLGSAADAFGRRPPLIFCAVLNFLQFAAMLGWVYGLVPLWVYFAANVLASFDSTSVMLAYLSDVVPAPQRAYCFGLLFATISLGVVVAPFVAVALGSGTNAPFLVAAGVSLFYLILVCFVPESLPKSKRVPFSSLRDLNPFRIIGVLGRYKMFQRLALVVLLGELTMRGRFAINFSYLKSRFHITEAQFAYVALTFGVLGVLSQSVLLKWLVRRWSNQRIMLLGLCAVVLNMLSFVVIWKLWMVYPTELFSCLSFLSFPAVSAMKSNNVADSEQGKIQGALYGVKQLGGGLGPVLFGLMFNAMGDPDDGRMYHPTLVWWLGAAVALITVFIGFSVPQAVTSDEQKAYEKEKEKEKAAAAAAEDTAASEALASVVVCDSPSINGGMVNGDTRSLMQPLMPPDSAQSW